jgi:hypothetical protein
MRISEMLHAIASWLESPDNEAIILAEYDDDCLKVVSESCVQAAALLKITADTVDDIEPEEESLITPESIEDLANLASALDSSNDPALQKQASVIDELLLTIAANPTTLQDKKAADEKKIDELKKKYHENKIELDKLNKIPEIKKAIDKSNMIKSHDVTDHSLSTRTCPDHPGAQIGRVGENMYQCELDKKVYNFEIGFELNNGEKVPGGSVNNQSSHDREPIHSLFDTREGRLQSNMP